jgi:NAD(P)-dependent dehydrogenase (short-subunit alcohol dehydrogenase family)
VERFGAVHVLCNNAGVTRLGLAWELPLEDWDWVLGINLRGVIHGVKAFVPGMIERGEPAHVVNTASIGGLLAFKALAVYTASKFAVVGLSESLLHELREQGAPVGVSVLCPGPVATNLQAHSAALHPEGEAASYVDEAAADVVPMAAAPLADLVVDAILAARFWILTHPAYNELIERRYRGIVETDEVVSPPYL